MQLQERINAFVKLGDFIRQFSSEDIHKADNVEHNETFFDGFKHQIKLTQEQNGWFTITNITFALNSWVNALTKSNMSQWLKPYDFSEIAPKTVAIVMA